ncbi:MAG: hypothetical protein IJS14_15385 [Lentisphaeria bacterium]|nr:hypothetical protein [Lentisphaeria bacterium]
MSEISKNTLAEILKGCKGSREHFSKVKEWLLDNVRDNMDRTTRVTLNIWSAPGVGKTSMVKELANVPVDWNGKHWDGFKIVDIPLAQIEEMGDVLGFPVEEIKMVSPDKKEVWIKAVGPLIDKYLQKKYETTGEQRTQYAPPAWVPKEECPGILLFDDGNRASQRIMKGLMQLVQDYRTISWNIPRGWTIVFTGNPDNRQNQVTSLDTAQLTRMKHITLLPDVGEWAKWACVQKDIDIRIVQWALNNPELFIPLNGERTNPRSLSEFGRALRRFPDLKNEEEFRKCMIEGNASLDETVVNSIMVFLRKNVGDPVETGTILTDSAKACKLLQDFMKLKHPRIDLVNISNERLLEFLLGSEYRFDASHPASLQAWLTDEWMPKDCAFSFISRLLKNKPDLGKKLLNCKKIMVLAGTGSGPLG